MPRLTAGDRVQLVGDISRFYTCVVGVVIDDGTLPSSVLNQYKVRLADGTNGVFFDFQLQLPAASRAQLIFDSAVSEKKSGTRGPSPGRHVRMAGRDLEIHLKIGGSTEQSVGIVGQVTLGARPLQPALVSLLGEQQPLETKVTDGNGEFHFSGAANGEVTIEIFAQGRRVLASFTL
jgi:hypothetical protein